MALQRHQPPAEASCPRAYDRRRSAARTDRRRYLTPATVAKAATGDQNVIVRAPCTFENSPGRITFALQLRSSRSPHVHRRPTIATFRRLDRNSHRRRAYRLAIRPEHCCTLSIPAPTKFQRSHGRSRRTQRARCSDSRNRKAAAPTQKAMRTFQIPGIATSWDLQVPRISIR
jgi:hypothetical protein